MANETKAAEKPAEKPKKELSLEEKAQAVAAKLGRPVYIVDGFIKDADGNVIE